MDKRGRIGRFLRTGGVLALLIFAAGPGCKMGAPDYTLTVTLPIDVTGTPPTGQYVYKELSQVAYDYIGVNPLHTVEVWLNGTIRREASGTIVMYGDGYQLTAKLVDLRGAWKVTMTQVSPVTNPVVTDTFTVTLTGADLLGGDFTDDKNPSRHGTWSAISGTLVLSYSDWSDYVFTGTVFSVSGTYQGNSTSGTWGATKVT